ncbi:hypothetical protein AM1BK_35830 [Neobacillus kokaensis]|uniref:Beta-galactosidase n=1 Tax=Neobacillus kokaensis TaxID=2759023 RepID=A0ABQ3N525_9BACI|nr:hypothetical protein AM1BK_35830 [Neobacillus kokaensis]
MSLPHDWSIELDFNKDSLATHEGGYLDGGVGWYRKTFTVPSAMEGKRISLDFDGVYMNSTTYLNGEELGTYPFGYNAFSYDITDKLFMDGRENVLAVKVDNTQPSSRWYSGSGIYRNVYLTVTNPVHVARYGTFVTTPDLESAYAARKAEVNIKTKINNDSDAAVQVKVKSTIYDTDGKEVASVVSQEKTAAAGTTAHFEDNTVIENPELWSLDNPYRYKLVTDVLIGGETVDTYETRFGARFFKFDANEGFSLNGKPMKLYGVSMHHDLGALGAATNARAVERQLQIMKDMGVNAIRGTHNPVSPEFLEAVNNLGLLLIEEAFDCWSQSKKTYDYGRFFTRWAEHDVKEMVDRGKNEPSIIMWSIGNEIYDTTSPSGVETARNLVRWIKEIDTTRPTTIGEDKTRGDKVNVTPIDPNILEIFHTVDVVGLNYSENNYVGYHEQHPNWKLYGSETSSATRSRGVYTHPYEYNLGTKYDDLQQSSYDNDYVPWGRTAEDAWKSDRDLKHFAGQFIWTGFDYIGEPTPYYDSYPAKSSYFGAVDTAGFPKDIFYYYQSQWKKEPMVHLLPHWNWTEGEPVRVLAYTNAHQVELFLNGKSLGVRGYENKKTSWGAPYKETKDGKTYLEWAVPFKAGTLEAVAMDENGKEIARDQVTTAGAPAAVKLTADRKVIKADGTDLSFITAEIVDSKGNVVPNADHLIQFHLSGHGELAGVDNGDAASVERYKDNKRKAFSGKALAIVQSNKLDGNITLHASAEGLSSGNVTIFTTASADQNSITIAGIDEVNVLVDFNVVPELPSQIKVYYSDSTVEMKPVTWDAVDPNLLNTAGKIIVEGTVEGTDKKAKALLIVKGNGQENSEYRIDLFSPDPKLISTELTVEKTNIMEDDFIDIKVIGQLENKEVVDLSNFMPIYEFDCDIIKIEGNKLYALEEGLVKVTAAVTYKGRTVTSPEMMLKITKNPVPKTITHIDSITVVAGKGEAPVLPATAVAHFDRGMPRDVKVKWEIVNPALYQNLGEFTVSGDVEGTEIKAQAKVMVRSALAIETISMAVLPNQKPELPQKVTVYYSDGTEEQADVDWDAMPSAELKSEGVVKVKGSVKGVDLKATAQIRVTSEVGGVQNISRAKNGYEYPKAEASFTNTGPGSNDRIEAINDDVISYDAEPHNRWTNWQPTPRPGDWVSITFGDSKPRKYDIDSMEIHWYEDLGTSSPAYFRIQYKSGDEWKDVSGLKTNPSNTVLRQANVYTFDKVRTSAIRVDMTAKTGKSLAITEIKVFSKWAKAHTHPMVTDIKLGDLSILDDFSKKGDNNELTFQVKDPRDIPEIKVKAEDNTSITIIPTFTAPSTAKIIAKSEDGMKVEIYNIRFTE